jgi:hypothetical protein
MPYGKGKHKRAAFNSDGRMAHGGMKPVLTKPSKTRKMTRKSATKGRG